jgi:predicted HAD superfamily phosphohydrolase YqeG
LKAHSIEKKTIVFDLDETLVRAQQTEPENGYDARIRVIDPDEEDYFVSSLGSLFGAIDLCKA